MSRTASPDSRRSAAPPPDPEAFAADPAPSQPAPGREANGRFARGNLGGPGNPFARQTAALRKQLLEAVTQQDMQDICTMLILRAKGGSVPHLKLLFSYIIGKPTDAVNPDTLDRQEMEQYRQELGMEDLVLAVGRALTPAFACIVTRAIRPVIMERIGSALADQLLQGVPPEFLPTDPDAEGEPAPPSPNGEIDPAAEGEGHCAEAGPGDEAPSANGENRPSQAAAAPATRKTAPMTNGENRPAAQARDAKHREKTAGDRPQAPQPRRAPPWPGGSRPTIPPEARGPAEGPAGRQRGPGNSGEPPQGP
jgi:hypothetical protein